MSKLKLKILSVALLLNMLLILSASPSAALPSSSPYKLSFVIQPSDILAGSSLFATTVLTHPIKNLISSNAIQFQVYDRYGKPAAGMPVFPITTDSRGLAVFAGTVLLPGKAYTLVASCGELTIRSRTFDVISPEPVVAIAAANVPPSVPQNPPVSEKQICLPELPPIALCPVEPVEVQEIAVAPEPVTVVTTEKRERPRPVAKPLPDPLPEPPAVEVSVPPPAAASDRVIAIPNPFLSTAGEHYPY